jgi:hypothetical protein
MSSDQSSVTESRVGPSVVPNPHRHGTMSTVGSEKHSLPFGIWKLLIHGNCPRCSHRHKATPIRFEVSKDPSDATPIQCEKCDHRWLTIGGRNNTETSLLSTQTTEPDPDEISFRDALFSFVRSATALDSVPEGPSRVPSRGKNVRMQSDNSLGSPTSNVHQGGPHASTPGQDQDATTASPSPQHQSTRQELLSNNVKLTKVLLRDFKRKLRRHFPILNRVHLRKTTMPSTPRAAVAPTGTTPTAAPPQHQTTAQTPDPLMRDTTEQCLDDKCSIRKQSEDVCTPAKSTTQAIEEIKNFDKEALKTMSSEERTAWIREKITAFKCRCSRQCTCKRRRRSSSIMVDSSTKVHILPPVLCNQYCGQRRRHSLEGIGSHLDCFAPGQFYHGQPLTISATRTSEADTVVESNTFSSSARTSRIDFVQRQRHRSWSPRPASLMNVRHSLQHRLEAQPSMDSTLTGGVAGSSSRGRRRGPDRRSRASLPPSMIPPRSESPAPAHD